MIAYLDASVIVPFLIAEPSSPRIRLWLDTNDELVVSEFARGEVTAALHRAVRNGREPFADINMRLQMFERWCEETCSPAPFAVADMRTAADYVRRFDLALRMPDALHLAACARLGLTLASFDRRLLRAAEALGVAAVRPG